MKLADRMSRLGTETAFEVLARAQALEARGLDIVHLEIGEPDFSSPESAIEAGIAGLRAGLTKYTTSAGLGSLRGRIADVEGKRRGLDLSADQVIVTPGGKPIMFYTILALVQDGNEVLYPDPGFPIYESMIRFVGGTPVPYPLLESREFRFDLDFIADHLSDRTRLLIVNSPNNPTGGVESREDLKDLAGLVGKTQSWVLSDEIYSHFIFEGAHHSIAEFEGIAERCVILDGFSKTYSMTGWRLGFGIMPAELVPHINRLLVNSVSCTPGFTQEAGLAALETRATSIPPMIDEYRRRRKVIVDGLNRIPGVRCILPHGTFYAFPNVSSFGRKSKEIAEYLLDDAGVACLAGTAFGAQGEGFLRLSFAASMDRIRCALERITTTLAKYG
jgi:aspartate/methionine/tyrosine aminotransferase